jgi:hypothetical protein
MDDHTKPAVQQEKITPDLNAEGNFRTEEFQNEVGKFPEYWGRPGVDKRSINITPHAEDYTVRRSVIIWTGVVAYV